MIFTYQNRKFLFSLSAIIAMLAMTGCNNRQAAQPPPVTVKALQVIQQDTPVTYEYVGQVIAKKEVQIRAKISGNIVEKMVNGGDTVTQGQPLFLLDRRQYEAALLESQGQLAQSEAALNNSHLDTVRYQKLADQQAIANQVLDTALSTERQNTALVNVNRARVQRAEADLQDTLIIASFSGRIDTNDLSTGSFVQAGQTIIATLSAVDPIFIQFSMSENEYLRFTHLGLGTSPTAWGNNLQLILSDGTRYPLTGHIEQVDRGLAQDTATLTLKSVFANPDALLMPGMFARVVAQGEIRQGALLIPQRAVQQLLGKTMVTIVGEDNKAEVRPVKLGPRVGNMWVVEEGLLVTDSVVVEGFGKAPPGTALEVEMMNSDELQNIMKN
ncbi:efflux RND transporter periplasmic adaptor subunit [Sporomusa acidovorans]|uniref:Multidrug efflux pump subunit AcrA n=1 Tax=Sporomusa acidovorans (strain ATCC 49682 / DSM 3132 / Mol) TaxID=1123286 RepID=A0ABZ3J5V4_SPOA4|nr:efflux RND transporter periplasmic adaptor subunit [Sporomusa acidovorans]OZC18245.1 multidrug efflux pump subunit AcrA precursor [Sporomusa acidovorans DSM 3132]SDF25793.1 membrane fusion protein, multidrug efflux system [Sporomusa acidovorans]